MKTQSSTSKSSNHLKDPGTLPVHPRAVCVSCHCVHEKIDRSTNQEAWHSLVTYLSQNKLEFSDIELADDYCSSCLERVLRQRTNIHMPSPEGRQDNGDRPSLLIVDNNPSEAKILEGILRDWGYEVFIAENGWKALVMVERHEIKAILVDLHMPVMDGRTMLDELRWIGHKTPVFVMGEKSEKGLLRDLLKEGAQDFFLKPLNLNFLHQTLIHLFGNEEKMKDCI